MSAAAAGVRSLLPESTVFRRSKEGKRLLNLPLRSCDVLLLQWRAKKECQQQKKPQSSSGRL